ncbi:type II toxin-antitoxin system HipA family toxin [Bradyrhizobium roseum]|uniref:type II toxin-antitoxin system HipA family toxin n=1 Tax=Bradyrhizobium roseum TaxID=3056648 RepID=UPI00262FB9A4|nr:HipA domain-containing protein [Bradyrhizobium roseus]WKA30035.1 HipA domain-containing protein [Bradyrhizobium roseus]
MTARSAEILFKDKVVGTLDETATGGSRFTYNADWNTEIGCCFPVSRREHEWKQGLHPFFQHLGPEGWLRDKQTHVAHLQEQDDLGLLLRFGADCIGAVSVRDKNGAAQNLPPVKEATANPGRTISGVQRKLLVVEEGDHFAPAAATGPAPYIAKFNSERLDSLVRNEALSLRWAAALLGADEVNTFTQGQVSKLDEVGLVVTRFDRTQDNQKLRLEDFAQILVKPRGADFSGKYDASYEEVATALKKHSVRPEIDLSKFFRRVIVFVLIGNCDAHLKNFSLLETPQGLRLSPAYDILNTALYDGYDQNIALSIDGKKPNLDEVAWPLLSSFGLRIGLSQAAVDQARTDIKARVKKAARIIEPPRGEPPDGFVHRYSDIVRGACLRILEE